VRICVIIIDCQLCVVFVYVDEGRDVYFEVQTKIITYCMLYCSIGCSLFSLYEAFEK
jgi:hypothetical protein